MKNLIFVFLSIFITLFFAGCPSTHSYLASKPPAFAKGYEDGCKSGEKYWENNLIDYKTIDPNLRENPDYRDGWREGYNRCYSEKETEIWMTRGRF